MSQYYVLRLFTTTRWSIVKSILTGYASLVNCAERLVALFGSQADVARAFQLDRAVVHNWVKAGYVPARWAGEVERVTQGRISALDVINEASEEPGAREVAPRTLRSASSQRTT